MMMHSSILPVLASTESESDVILPDILFPQYPLVAPAIKAIPKNK
jgi:hypothetical protein